MKVSGLYLLIRYNGGIWCVLAYYVQCRYLVCTCLLGKMVLRLQQLPAVLKIHITVSRDICFLTANARIMPHISGRKLESLPLPFCNLMVNVDIAWIFMID